MAYIHAICHRVTSLDARRNGVTEISLYVFEFFLWFLLSLSALSSSVVNDSGRICWKSSPMHGPTWGERKDEEAAMHMLISLEACIGWALWSCRWVVWLDLASPSPQCQGGMGEGG